MPTFDATMLRDFRSCAELFRSRHKLGLVKLGLREEPLEGGRAWHKALEYWFGQATSDLDGALAALRQAWGDELLFPTAPQKRPLELYERTLRGYAEKWPREADGFRVLRNERWEEAEFTSDNGAEAASLANKTLAHARVDGVHESPRLGFSYGAIFDRDIEMADGSVYAMDSKSTGSYLGDAFFGGFALSTQLRGQVALKLVKGERCDGAMVDAAHLNTRGTTVDKEKHFGRQIVTFPQHMLDSWARDVEASIRHIERLEQERGVGQRWPQNEASCFSWNRPCAMLSRCLTEPELAEGVEGFAIKPWQPWALRESEVKP